MTSPVIPQTPDQARSRDHAHGLARPLEQTAEAELARLRNAMRQHRDATKTARKADQALWAHLNGDA